MLIYTQYIIRCDSYIENLNFLIFLLSECCKYWLYYWLQVKMLLHFYLSNDLCDLFCLNYIKPFISVIDFYEWMWSLTLIQFLPTSLLSLHFIQFCLNCNIHFMIYTPNCYHIRYYPPNNKVNHLSSVSTFNYTL